MFPCNRQREWHGKRSSGTKPLNEQEGLWSVQIVDVRVGYIFASVVSAVAGL